MYPGLIFPLPFHFFFHLGNLLFLGKLSRLLWRRVGGALSPLLAEDALVVGTNSGGLSECPSSMLFLYHLVSCILFYNKCLARFLDVLHLLFYFVIDLHDILLLLNVICVLPGNLPN